MEGEDAAVNACRESCCCFLDLKICRLVYLAALSRLVDVEQRKELGNQEALLALGSVWRVFLSWLLGLVAPASHQP